MLVLGKIGTNAIGGRLRRDVHVADGLAADVPGRRKVALHQRGRHPKNVGDIVETAAFIVRRQQRAGIDVQRQQIMDGIRIFGTIQPMHGRASRIGFRRCSPIDGILENTG